MTSLETVQTFLSALERMDVNAVLALVDDAIVYENVGVPPARGRKQFEQQMRAFERYFDHFEARVVGIAENGPLVLTERIDVLGAGGVKVEFWVCGRFEVQAGKIVVWRDYFDWAQTSSRFMKNLPRLAWALASKRRSRA